MGVLNTTLRCNHCGYSLPEGVVSECPGCRADLTQVGVWSELLEWGKTRQIRRTRYIWRHGVLGWGGFMALFWSLVFFLRGAGWPFYLFLVALSLLGGYFLGWWHWRRAE